MQQRENIDFKQSSDSGSSSSPFKPIIKPPLNQSPQKTEEKTTSSPQTVVKRLKYEMCKNWREKGNCRYGDRCLFAHGTDELTKA